jgi:hypothetical protein
MRLNQEQLVQCQKEIKDEGDYMVLSFETKGGYCYHTLGLGYHREHPEFIMFTEGLDQDLIEEIVGNAAQMVMTGKVFTDGEVWLDGQVSCKRAIVPPELNHIQRVNETLGMEDPTASAFLLLIP